MFGLGVKEVVIILLVIGIAYFISTRIGKSKGGEDTNRE
jgi:hypothetical protein